MTLIYGIYSGVAFLAICSIVVLIVLWVRIGRITVLVGDLEKEIEKKALEFDALRKDRASTSRAHIIETPPSVTDAQVPPVIQPPDLSVAGTDSPDIQVFRNVGGTFARSAARIHPIVHPQDEPQITKKSGRQQPLPAVDDETADGMAPGRGNDSDSLRVRLVSKISGDLDLDALSRDLHERFPQPARSRIEIDFTNILFLYDKELERLAEIVQYIRSREGIALFVNCEGELRNTLAQHPLFSDCIATALPS